ncbi:MAG: TDG/mug DNA glycosylase family protein [Planctomycetota bacterium]
MAVANVSSFLPVARKNARVLILGSMPGIASLEAQRYYAHPRNAFWPILAEICGFDRELAYEQRLKEALSKGIALWDVLASCAREGSLDSDIEAASIRTNDFAGFLSSHPGVTAVFCNGGAAFQMFRKRVVPGLPEEFAKVRVRQLPSSSPAHASMTLAQKRDVWVAEIGPLLQ